MVGIGSIKNTELQVLCHQRNKSNAKILILIQNLYRLMIFPELQEQIKQLQMEVDVLKEALNLLKKRPRHQCDGTKKP